MGVAVEVYFDEASEHQLHQLQAQLTSHGIPPILRAAGERSIWSSGYTVAHLEASQNALAFYLRRGYIHCGPPDCDGAYPLRKARGADGLLHPS